MGSVKSSCGSKTRFIRSWFEKKLLRGKLHDFSLELIQIIEGDGL
jgi:hypothetical protein